MMALSPGSACTYASLQPSYMLNALSAQDDVQEVVHYSLEKTVQEVRILRFNPLPPPTSRLPPFSYFSSLFTLSSSYSSGSSLSSLCSSTSTGFLSLHFPLSPHDDIDVEC